MSIQAPLLRSAIIASLVVLAPSSNLFGASVRSQNFIVTASSEAWAQKVLATAEAQRKQLAIEWLGRELPPWRDPCPIEVRDIPGAGGVTSFAFENGVPMGWQMAVQGSRERILDSVLPHEITHTIFATHFRQPLPRWADEGACTTVEHTSERKKQDQILMHCLSTGRGIPFSRMFRMMDYPDDMLSIYAQGYSVSRFLIGQGGKKTFIKFVDHGLKTKDWNAAVRLNYGYKNLSELQLTWNDWVKKGSPQLPKSARLVSSKSQVIKAKAPATAEVDTRVALAKQAPAESRLRVVEPGRLTPVAPLGQTAVAQLPRKEQSQAGWYAAKAAKSSTPASSTGVSSQPEQLAQTAARQPLFQPGSIGRVYR